MAQNVLKVENLSVSYGHINAVTDVSLTVDDGEIVAPVGANGAGKSTLMKAILGIQRPSRGRITFQGQDITRWPTARIVAAGIAYIPEGGGVLPLMTIRENLLLGGLHYKGNLNAQMDKIYAQFPILKEREGLAASTLSGGQRQMLAIGRALMGAPKLLMMDEPSLGIAPLIVTEIFNTIRELSKMGHSILLSEQNARKALEYADRAYVFQTGLIKLHGHGKEILDNPDVQRAYLGG